jgi:hypothetical protein
VNIIGRRQYPDNKKFTLKALRQTTFHPLTTAQIFPPLTLSYSSKINGFLSSEGFFTLEKNALVCYKRATPTCPSSRVWQPSAYSNGSLEPFLFVFKLSAGAPYRQKRPILDLRFLKNTISPQDTGRQLTGNPGIVSFRQFRDN